MIFILENNRTTDLIFWFNLHCHNKVHDSRPYGAHFSHNRSQLFRARFGRRIILHPLSNDVRSKLNKLKAVPSTQFEFCSFFIGYHSMKKTPFGWLLATLLLSTVVYAFSFWAAQVVCFLVGSCLVLVSLVEDISNDLKLLDVSIAARNAKENHQVEQRVHFCKIVQLHADIKE